MEQEQMKGQQGEEQGEQQKGNGKRSRSGNHDNTTTEDSDEELPNAKRLMPSLTEKLPQVYQRKTRDQDRSRISIIISVQKCFLPDKKICTL